MCMQQAHLALSPSQWCKWSSLLIYSLCVHCRLATSDLVNTVRDEHRRMDRIDRVGGSYYNDIIECCHGDYNLQITFRCNLYWELESTMANGKQLTLLLLPFLRWKSALIQLQLM